MPSDEPSTPTKQDGFHARKVPSSTYKSSTPVKLSTAVLLREEANLLKINQHEDDKALEQQRVLVTSETARRDEDAQRRARDEEHIRQMRAVPEQMRHAVYESWQSNVDKADEARDMEAQWDLERATRRTEDMRHNKALNELFRDTTVRDENMYNMYFEKHRQAMEVQAENHFLQQAKAEYDAAVLAYNKRRIDDEREHKRRVIESRNASINALRDSEREEERKVRKAEAAHNFRVKKQNVYRGLNQHARGPEVQSSRTPPRKHIEKKESGRIRHRAFGRPAVEATERVPWQSWPTTPPPASDRITPLPARPMESGYAQPTHRWRPAKQTPPSGMKRLPNDFTLGCSMKTPPPPRHPQAIEEADGYWTPRSSPASPRSSPRGSSPRSRGSQTPRRAIQYQRNEVRVASGSNQSVIKYILATLTRTPDRISFRPFAATAPIVTFPERLLESNTLRAIDLSDNLIDSLPDDLASRLPSLVWLSVANNRLRKLPDNIGLLTGVQAANFQGNQLAVLPASIGQMRALTDLDVSDNALRILPSSLFGLRKLTSLNVGNNKLSSIPPGISNVKVLKRLDCAFNNLGVLPRLADLKNLEHLDITGNPLRNIPATLRQREREGLYIARHSQPAQPRDIEPYLDAMRAMGLELQEDEEKGDLALSFEVFA